MFGVENEGSALDTIAHVIQAALTPVFLLTGIATLLNVFRHGWRGSPIAWRRPARRSKMPMPMSGGCWRLN
jgi:hypothetical protein